MISIRNSKFAKIGLENLCKYIKEKLGDNLTIIEIGSYVGDSTEIFAKHFSRVYAIDPWQNGYDDSDAASFQHPMSTIEDQFNKLCEKYSNIVKIKDKSSLVAGQFVDKSVDVVYIDGIHTYQGCRDDIELYKNKVKTGGLLCGHDYQSRFPGVIRAVDEFRKPDKIFEDTSWAIRL